MNPVEVQGVVTIIEYKRVSVLIVREDCSFAAKRVAEDELKRATCGWEQP